MLPLVLFGAKTVNGAQNGRRSGCDEGFQAVTRIGNGHIIWLNERADFTPTLPNLSLPSTWTMAMTASRCPTISFSIRRVRSTASWHTRPHQPSSCVSRGSKEFLVFVPCSVWTSKVVVSFLSAQSPFRISRPLGTHCRCSSYHGASDQPSPASCLTTTDLCCSACAHDTLSTCYAPMRCTRWPCAWFRASLLTLEKTPSPHLRYGSCASGSVRALGRATRRLIGFLATRTSDIESPNDIEELVLSTCRDLL